jgi:hypothetical protein
VLGLRVRSWLAVALSSVSISACSSSEETTPPQRKTGTLIDQHAWVPLDAADDPFASDRPAEIICPSNKAMTENFGGVDSFEVDTSGCNYASVGQPSLLEVKKGDTIYLEGWRGKTPLLPPAEAHIGVTLNGVVLFDKRYTIPWPCGGTLCQVACPSGEGSDAPNFTDPACERGGEIQPFVVVEEDAPLGSTIVFHVHNHGDNKYGLIKMEISAVAP